jgi:hypothetical protein
MENDQIVTSLQIQHRSLDFWFRRFLAYRSRLFVGIENFRENRVLEFASFNAFCSPLYPWNYLFVLLTIFTF